MRSRWEMIGSCPGCSAPTRGNAASVCRWTGGPWCPSCDFGNYARRLHHDELEEVVRYIFRAIKPFGAVAVTRGIGYTRKVKEEREERDPVARGRSESESCEKGTPGCSVAHRSDSPCEPW